MCVLLENRKGQIFVFRGEKYFISYTIYSNMHMVIKKTTLLRAIVTCDPGHGEANTRGGSVVQIQYGPHREALFWFFFFSFAKSCRKQIAFILFIVFLCDGLL